MRTLFVLSMLVLLTLPGPAQGYLGAGASLGTFGRSGGWTNTYGRASEVSARVEYARPEGWLLAGNLTFHFGNQIRVDPLVGLRDASGGILGDVGPSGQYADVQLRSRGRAGALLIGYRASLPKNLKLRALLGPTYTVHWIRIQDDAQLTTSNLRSEYKRGYDRRAGGVGAVAELGLDYIPTDNSLVLFLVGTAGFTSSKPLNGIQFDLLRQAPRASTDYAFGLRLGALIQLGEVGGGEGADDIYY